MSRWKALYLAFPDDDRLTASIIHALDNAAPQLRELSIKSGVGFEGSFAQHSFGNLDSLEHLALEGEVAPRDFSRCSSIRILEILQIWDCSRLQDLNLLPELSSLHIEIDWEIPNTTIPDIVLPHLCELHLGGYIPTKVIQSFRCKPLSCLIVEGVDLGEIGWIPYTEADIFKMTKSVDILMQVSRDKDRTTILSNLAGLLDQLLTADTIGVQEDMADDILLSVMACREKGGLSALRSMVVIDEEGGLVREYTSFHPTAMCLE
jgi:hypothetical protein